MNILTLSEVQRCIDNIEEAMLLIGKINNVIKDKKMDQKIFEVPAFDFDSEAKVSFDWELSSWVIPFKPCFNILIPEGNLIKFYWDLSPFFNANIVLVNEKTNHLSLNYMENNIIIFKRNFLVGHFLTYNCMDITDPETELFLFQESLVQEVSVINSSLFTMEWHRRKLPNIQINLGHDPIKSCNGILNIIKLTREMHGFDGYDEYI